MFISILKYRFKSIFLILLASLAFSACTAQNKFNNNVQNMSIKDIRPAAAAGVFYPDNKSDLRQMVDAYLNRAETRAERGEIRAIVSPHAGYVYSGPVAAEAFAAIQGKSYDNVFIICNAHTAMFSGISLDGRDQWQTPLGKVGVNTEIIGGLAAFSADIYINNSAHAQDHTLEVQLPWLQRTLEGDFNIVPILFGNKDRDAYLSLAEALAKFMGDNDLLLVSTDMSHYPKYKDAGQIDAGTLEVIRDLDIKQLEEYIEGVEVMNVPGEDTLLCGIDAVKTLMKVAGDSGWYGKVLKYMNSGDAAVGDKSAVVGYGAMAFYANVDDQKTSQELNREQKRRLLDIAKTTVESYIKDGKIPEFDINDDRLNWQEGAFVTLHKGKRLRGCIGQIVPGDKPLWEVVRDMAAAACSEDPRFDKVNIGELKYLDYEVSVLSAPERIDDWRRIELGKHGVIVQQGFRSGVFLPQVAGDTDWSLEEFLGHLCGDKAGLDPKCYRDGETNISIFTAQVFGDDEL